MKTDNLQRPFLPVGNFVFFDMGMSYHVTRTDAKCPAEFKNKGDPLFPLSGIKIDLSKGYLQTMC